ETPDYQYQVLLNGKVVSIGAHNRQSTVDMTGKPVLDAYRFLYKGKIIYNTYNLLRGDDEWDPVRIKELVLSAEKESGNSLINLPTQLLISPTKDTIETGRETIVLTSKANKFGNYELKNEKVEWKLAQEYQSLARLKVNDDGTCTVTPTNNNDETKQVIIMATTHSGLEAASVIFVSPSMLIPPGFNSLPKIINHKDGKLVVNYKLDTRFKDQSLINW